jgi:two-component system, OmpR family, sensor kinase
VIGRLPIRWRLTLAFALAMAIVLAIVAVFLRISLASELDDGIDASLSARADELAAVVAATGRLAGPAEGRLSELEEGFAQAVGADGRVLDASAPALRAPLLSEAEACGATVGAVRVDLDEAPGVDGPVRLLARPAGDGRAVVVGASLEDRDEAVAELTGLLLAAGPLALLAASALGYLVAARALRPVDAMRARAGEISGARSGERLPLPEARDELRRLGETLNAMLERIDAALRRERAFVADAGHELRTPIAVLAAEVELALTGDRTADELRAALRSSREEAGRLARLADDLLVLARMDEDRLSLHRERLDVPDLLDSVAARFAAGAAGAGRPLRVAAEPGLVVVADRVRVEQAVANLVDNALRHGEGAVAVRARRVAGAVELTVEDEGAGVPAEDAETVFDRFVRGPSADGGGAGLGLAIVRAVARAHGGEARIEGASAVIRLPDVGER